MKRFILFFGSTILIMIGVFVAVAASLPKHYNVQRSIVIEADSPSIHAFVGDLKKWDTWTPWKEVDPELVVTLGDRTQGIGASQTWDDVTGGGELVFIRSSPDMGIAYDLYFADFPKVDAEMNYIQLPDGNTEVVWRMAGEVAIPVFGGIFAMTMDMQVGPLFESGLEKLKIAVE